MDEKEKWDKSSENPSQWNTKSVIVLINQETCSVIFFRDSIYEKEITWFIVMPLEKS